MSENQVVALKNALEILLRADKLKVAEKERYIVLVQDNYRNVIESVLNEEFDRVLDISTLSKYIFNAAFQEVCENERKFEKNKSRIKNRLYDLSIQHLRICSEKEIDNNTVPWVIYILKLLKKSYIIANVHMENEITSCLYSCSVNSQLHWIQHGYMKELWSVIWQRVRSSTIDTSILGNLIKTAIRVVESVKLEVLDLNSYSLSKMVLSSLTQATIGQVPRVFWTITRKSAYVQMLTHLLKHHSVASLDLLLFSIPEICGHETFINMLTVYETSRTAQTFFDAFFQCFALLPANKMVGESAEKVRQMAADCAAHMLKSVDSLLTTTRSRCEHDDEMFVEFVARVLVIGKCAEEVEMLKKSCGQKSFAIRILTEILEKFAFFDFNAEDVVKQLWSNRKSFTSDSQRVAFCQFLTVYLKANQNFGVETLTVSNVLKYALALIANPTTVSSSASLIETILIYTRRQIPREMLPRIMDTLMTRGQPDCQPIQRVVLAFLANVDFEESWKVANSWEEEEEEEDGKVSENRNFWRFRKSIIDWLLTAPNATTAVLLRQITKYEPKMCNFEKSPNIDHPFRKTIELLHLVQPSTSTFQFQENPGAIQIENVVKYMESSLRTLPESANLLKLQILEKATDVEATMRSVTDGEFLDYCQHFETWPIGLELTEQLKTPPVLAWFCFLNLDNLNKAWIGKIDGNISAIFTEILSRLPMEPYRKSEIFGKFVSDFILENREDVYETTIRFEKFGGLLNDNILKRLHNEIWRITSHLLSTTSIEQCDAFVIQQCLQTTCLHYQTSKLSGNLYLDAFCVAKSPQNVDFGKRNCLKYLRTLRCAPYHAQNIVRNVLENEKIYRRFVPDVLQFVLENENLLMVCLIKIANFRRFLKIYQVNFNVATLRSSFLTFPIVRIDRCQKYLKFPRKFGPFIQPADFRIILMGTSKLGRISYRFWRLFDEQPGEICKVLMDFASECVKLGLTDRLRQILSALKTSEFSVPILRKSASRQVFTFICYAIQKNAGFVDMDDDNDVGFSVENFLKNGIDNLPFKHFACREFYWNLEEELSEEVLEICEEKDVHIFDILSTVWRYLPEMRQLILPLVARFNHLHPHFPQPSRSFCRDTFAADMRFKLALRIMSGGGGGDDDLSMMIMVYLRRMSGGKRYKLVKEDCFGRVCREFGRRVRSSDDVVKKYVMMLIEQDMPSEIAMMLLPGVFNSYVTENPNARKLVVSQLLKLSKLVDAENRDHIECICECIDAIGLSCFAEFEKCGDDEKGVEIWRFFELADLLVKHEFLNHAFAIANLIFDRLSYNIRNTMMISRLSLADLPTNSQPLIDLLKRIYIAENNSVALSTLPSNIHNCDDEVQRVSLRKSKEWLELFSAIGSDTKESTICQWMCGMAKMEAKNDEQVYLDAILRCDFVENYPKIIDSPEKLIYKILYNPVYELESMEKLRVDEYRLVQVAKGAFQPRNELEHVIYAIRKIRENSRKNNEQKSREIISVARMLAKSKAFKAALLILDRWIEKCRERATSIDESLVEICRCEILFSSGKHQIAEITLLPIKPKSIDAIAEHGLVQSRILIEYRNDVEEAMRILERTCQRIPDTRADQKLKVLLRFHDVCMDQLTELEKYKEGLVYRIKTEAIREFQTQIDQKNSQNLSRRSSSANVDAEENRRTVFRLRREQQCEQEHVNHIEANVVAAARKAVASGLAALETIGDDDATSSTLLIFPLIDVIYKYEKLDEIVAVLREHTTTRRVASRLWLCATSHIASKCFGRQVSPLKKCLRQILTQLVLDYPFHVLHTLFIYEHEANGAETRQFIDSIGGERQKLRGIIRDMRLAHDAYREFARLDVKNNVAVKSVKEDGKTVYQLPRHLKLLQCSLSKCPIPCIAQPVGKPGDYCDTRVVTWQSWHNTFQLADGLSTPKIWQIRGSDGRWYKTVWKRDDVRQDVLVEQMFDVTNCILRESSPPATKSSRTTQSLRTYRIVPLDQGCGIIEFCHGTVSMKELLCGADRQGGLHTRHQPNEPSISNITMRMREVQTDTSDKRRNVFVEICRDLSPVFRHHFYLDDACRVWRNKIAQYRKSLATWSMVGYIVGLGDRHTSNILFEVQHCHFVHIDFGMILEYSKRLLPVPELVPFRLTRDILDPILIEGIENGQLADECTTVLEKLKSNRKVLLGVASALLRETMSNFREAEQNTSRPSYISQMAIDRLREKLTATSSSPTAATATLEVRRLLRDATNADNLSRMFCGWMPFL